MKRRTLTTWGRVALGVAASIGLGWFVVRGLDWGEVVHHLSGISPVMTTLSLALFLVAGVVRAARWRILFVGEPRPSVPRLFIIQNEGIGLNNFLPLRIASEAMQFGILTVRDRVRPGAALAALGMERVVDATVTALIFAAALVIEPEMRVFSLYLAGVVGLVLLLVALARFIAWGGQALELIRRIPFLAAFGKAVRDLERERGRLAGSFALTFVYWLMIGAAAWVAADGIGLPISPAIATLVIIGTISFSTVVPAAPSAIATFEWAVVYMLGFFDVDRSAAFGYAVLVHAVFFLPPTIIAAVFLPREGISLGNARRKAPESTPDAAG